jgi:hypothetical protein
MNKSREKFTQFLIGSWFSSPFDSYPFEKSRSSLKTCYPCKSLSFLSSSTCCNSVRNSILESSFSTVNQQHRVSRVSCGKTAQALRWKKSKQSVVIFFRNMEYLQETCKTRNSINFSYLAGFPVDFCIQFFSFKSRSFFIKLPSFCVRTDNFSSRHLVSVHLFRSTMFNVISHIFLIFVEHIKSHLRAFNGTMCIIKICNLDLKNMRLFSRQ